MKKKRNPILIIILALMLIVLFGGIVVYLIQYLDEGKPSKEKVIKKTDQHTKLFSASEDNWGLTNSEEDYWSSSYWIVYYDGTVEYYENYNLTGETSHITWELNEEDYEKLYRNLEGRFLKCDEGVDACDGTAWSMTYYGTDGERIHHFFGYMYGIPVLEEIVEILDSDERDKVEKGDIVEEENTVDYTDIAESGAWKESTCYVGNYVMYIETLQAGHPGPDNVIHGASFDWCDEAGNTVWINQEYVYEDKGLSDYHESTEHLKSVTVGDKDFMYEMLPEGDLWMYYSIDEETCVVIKYCILGVYNNDGDGIDVSQFNLEDMLEEEIIEEAINFEVSKR